MASILGNIGEIINQTDNAAKTHDIQRIIDWIHCCGKNQKQIDQWEKEKVTIRDWFKDNIEEIENTINSKGPLCFNDSIFKNNYLNHYFQWPQKYEMISYCVNDNTGNLKLLTKIVEAINLSNITVGPYGHCLGVHGIIPINNFKGIELPDFIPFEPGRTHLILIGCPNLNRQKLTMNGIDYEDLGVQ